MIAVQGLEFSHSDDKPHAALARTLRSVFAQVHSYRATVPSFLSSWGFLLASDWLDANHWQADDIDRRIDASSARCGSTTSTATTSRPAS